jgi:hypothetical protein
MTRKSFILRRNADGTVTFKTRKPNGRWYVEHFSTDDKGLLQTYEYIKAAAVTAGISLSEPLLEELLREAQGLKQ